MQSHSTDRKHETRHGTRENESNMREKENRVERTQKQGGIQKSPTDETNYTK